jgi:hypothetical protein
LFKFNDIVVVVVVVVVVVAAAAVAVFVIIWIMTSATVKKTPELFAVCVRIHNVDVHKV